MRSMRIDLQSTEYWPSRVARYAVALLLFVIGLWTGTLYRAGEGPFLWFMVSMVLTAVAVIVGVVPDIVAWRARRNRSRLQAEK